MRVVVCMVHDCTFKHVDTNTQGVTILQTGQYSGERYLVTGPIADRAEVQGEQELYFASDIVFPYPGALLFVMV